MIAFFVWAISGTQAATALIAVFFLSGSLLLLALLKQRPCSSSSSSSSSSFSSSSSSSSSSYDYGDLQQQLQCRSYYYGTDVDPTSFHNSSHGSTHPGSSSSSSSFSNLETNVHDSRLGGFSSWLEVQNIEDSSSSPLTQPDTVASPGSGKKHTPKKKVRFSADVVEPLGNGKDYRTRMMSEISSRRRKRSQLRNHVLTFENKREEEKPSRPARSASSSSSMDQSAIPEDEPNLTNAEEVIEWNMQLLPASPFAFSQQSSLYFSRNDQYHLLSTVEI